MEIVLKNCFGHKTFRPFQREIVTQILSGKDCMVVMATGSGKSVCYQMPPIITEKTAVVISPLISLMQDQVMGLKQRGIRAEYLGSAQTDSTISVRAERGEFHVLYMTPEKACNSSSSFWSSLLDKGVCLLAVDEAHCISEWGHDFRHEYQRLHTLRTHLPNVPFVALTATATHKVREDIIRGLDLRNYLEVISSFDRPNIYYGVKTFTRTSAFREELAQEVLKDIAGGGSTLIYCTTVKDVEEVTNALVKVGVNARSYHAQLGQRLREEIHRAFSTDELQVVVATVAFGMGIDKPDIRRVIHYGCPKSLESYYQESGRCGRDGLPATSWLFFARQDFVKGDFYAASTLSKGRREAVMEAYAAAQKYCLSTDCRRALLLQYFGETISFQNCGSCDNCKRPGQVEHRDMAQAAHLLLSAVRLCGGRWGLNMPIDVLRGSKAKKIVEYGYDKWPVHGLGRDKSPLWWKILGGQLMTSGHLKEVRKALPTGNIRLVSVAPSGETFLATSSNMEEASLILPVNIEMVEEERKLSSSGPVSLTFCQGGTTMSEHLLSLGFSELEIKLYNHLLEARRHLARKNFTAPYAICNETTLQKFVKVRPSSEARLRMIDGVNQWLVARHGQDILTAIKDLSTAIDLPLDNTESSNQPRVLRGDQPTVRTGDRQKITPAKEEAWRMWEQEGLTFTAIATLPDRPKPIKEDTVIGYISDCVAAGYEVDMDRFCKETGLTGRKADEIRVAIEKVGSSDLLKPIKEQLPESVTYGDIKVYLMLETCGFSLPKSPEREKVELESRDCSQAPDSQVPVSQETFSQQACNSQVSQQKILQQVPDQVNGSSKSPISPSEDAPYHKPPWMSNENGAVTTRRRVPTWTSMEAVKKRSKVEDL